MLDLEPPKPTKEFHEAYMEIYGKAKKKEEKKEEKKETLFSADQKPAEIKPPVSPSLNFNDLDAPPLKLQKLELPEIQLVPQQKKEKPAMTLDDLDLPPLKGEIPLLDLSALQQPEKPAKAEKKPLFSFLKKERKASELDMPPLKLGIHALDEPPKKIPAAKIPSLKKWEIESPAKEVKEITKKKPVHDFLAEIKNGSKTKFVPEVRTVTHEPFPVFDEHKEGAFEKSTSKKGARDVQFALEKTHPFETAGHEYLEKIQPLEKPIISIEEPEEMPKVQKFKSPAEFKQYMKRAKGYEQQTKKLVVEAKKQQQALKLLLKKQQLQNTKINEKMKKIEQMEQELHQQQEDAKNYEPRLQELYAREDIVMEKERELKQRQEDIHDTEQTLRIEENSILAKIKRLEADQKLLDKQQDAIAKTVAKMEKEKAQIAAKIREFSQIMKDISAAEKELKEKAEFFADRDEALKRKERMIEKEVTRVEALKKKAEKLKDVEQTYDRMKKRLREAYQEYEEKFLNKEVYTQKEMHFEPTVRVPEQPKISHETGDITNLISLTKQLIINKRYEEANRNISKLMQRYMQIPENNPRKKEIYYDILSVKNMLKLDLLE